MTSRTLNIINTTIDQFVFCHPRKFFVLLASIILIITYSGSNNLLASQERPFPQTFILMANDSGVEQFNQLQSFIEARAGQVTHLFPYRAMIVKMPSDTIQQLRSVSGVAELFTEAVDLAKIDRYGSEAHQLVSVWNHIVAPSDQGTVMSQSIENHFGEEEHAFIAPDLPPDGGSGLAAASSVTPDYYQTSEYMAGSIAVGIVLVESNGATDPSTENWDSGEKQTIFNEIVSAMNWWATLEPRANLSFVYDDHFTSPLPTNVEPINRSYTDQKYWIKDTMGALGYTSSSYFTRVRDYNNDLRDTYQTDWAFTIFVVDSSNDSDNRFSDGYFAYAYLGGPFMVMTYGNNGYGSYHMDAVAAHEMGHIFHALDQYAGARQSCDRKSGYLDISNQNSQYGNCALNAGSIMRGQVSPFYTNLIDSYAAGQIGWRDSDNDNIFDPLDTDLPITIDSFSQTGNTITVAGAANIIPYPSPRRTSVTINKLTDVKYRFNDGGWQSSSAGDGKFNSTSETYHFSTNITTPGLHTLQVAATDSAGNMSGAYATKSVAILDPIDGGLNTEIAPSSGQISVTSLALVQGKAYHMQGGQVANVEYKINGGAWQSASALDGAFDSSYEEFRIGQPVVEPGTYVVEARAIDSQGHVEVNSAHREVQVKEAIQLFVPLITLHQ